MEKKEKIPPCRIIDRYALAHLEQRFVRDGKRLQIGVGVGVGVVGSVVGVGSCLFLGVDCATAAKIADKQP